MENFKRILFLLVLLLSFNLSAQEWVQYSDSILSNIRRNDIESAESYMLKAEEELNALQPLKDSLYAKYYYRKGLVKYFLNQNPEKSFLTSLEVWNSLQEKNYTELVRVHYFFAMSYFDSQNDSSAEIHFEEVYRITNEKDVIVTGNYINTLYYLAFLNYNRENFEKAEIYASEYIKNAEKDAYNNFDFRYAQAFLYSGDIESQRMILVKFLENYRTSEIDNPKLLLDIHIKLMNLFADIEDPVNAIIHGEKALSVSTEFAIPDTPNKLIFSLLIWAYQSTGDNINYKKYKNLESEYFPNNQELDYYDHLEELILNEKYDLFKSTFNEFEQQLIVDEDYNKLLEIYSQSLTLFERNIIFNKEKISEQLNLLISKKDQLNKENKILIDLIIAEFSVFTGDFLQALNLSNLHSDAEENTIRLNAYRYKTLAEFSLGMSSAGESAGKALRIAEDSFGKDSPEILPYILMILTTTIEDSPKVATQGLRIIYENGLENTEIAAQLWVAQGEEAFKIGNYEDAEVYYNRALEIYDKAVVLTNPVMYNIALLGMAKTVLLQKEYSKSWEYLMRAKEGYEKQTDKASLFFADYYEVLGHYYFYQDKYEEAKGSYKKAFELYGDGLSANRKLNYLLSDYFLEKESDQTEKELREYYDKHGDIGNVLELLYLLLYSEKKDFQAREILVKSIENTVEENSYFSLYSETEKELVFQRLLSRFEYLNTHLLSFSDPEFLSTYIDLRFYIKSLILSSMGKPEEVAKEFYSELSNNNKLISKYYESNKNFKGEIEKLSQRNRELEKFLVQESKVISTPGLQEVREKLGSDEVYVEVIRINKQARNSDVNRISDWEKFTDSIYYGALIIKKEEEPKFVLIDRKDELENDHLVRFQNFSSGKYRDEIDTLSFSKFFEPIANEIADQQKIYFVPDGIYNSINLEALYIPEKGKYLIETFKIKRLLSARSLFKQDGGTSLPRDKTAILLGNPDFELPIKNLKEDFIANNDVDIVRSLENQGLISYLPGTQKEIDNISSILSTASWKTKVFSLNSASEENLKNISSPSILHIATHGYFIDDFEEKSILPFLNISDVQKNPLLKSGLLLSGSQNTLNGNFSENTENGIFMSQEAKSLKLTGTDLVVLSACETGLGNFQVGEGVYGLQRAFMMAGAESVLMSLWQVDDEATNQLMTAFYINFIEKKMSKHEALISAKEQLKEKYSSPFYWAPFILIE